MADWTLVQFLMKCFPNSIINHNMEFIAHVRTNQYILLGDCQTELDVKCKVLEWFSRSAYKTEPYRTKQKNDEFHKFMRTGINTFLGTLFTEEDMNLIYTYLGNRCNHELTVQFVCRDYDLHWLKSEAKV